MGTKKNSRINKLGSGFLAGLVLPLIVFIVAYFARQTEIPFFEYVSGLWNMGMIILILKLCVLPNLIIFLLFTHKKFDMAARGVLLATFIYAFITVFSFLF